MDDCKSPRRIALPIEVSSEFDSRGREIWETFKTVEEVWRSIEFNGGCSRVAGWDYFYGFRDQIIATLGRQGRNDVWKTACKRAAEYLGHQCDSHKMLLLLSIEGGLDMEIVTDRQQITAILIDSFYSLWRQPDEPRRKFAAEHSRPFAVDEKGKVVWEETSELLFTIAHPFIAGLQ